MSKANQKAIWNRLKCLNKHVDLKNTVEVEKFIYSMTVKNAYKIARAIRCPMLHPEK